MQHAVVRKQENSKSCLVCGLKNPFGLQAAFYELENGELVCMFTPSEMHQSYPRRMHGGIAAALLDETIGRAILMRSEHVVWGVTLEVTTKFRKPIPLDQQLRVVGRITLETSRLFEGTGEIYLPDGQIAATGFGKYMKLPINKIADFDEAEQEWKVNLLDTDPKSFDVI
jgi:acyl-coenzyme A thioesterase PaaI-like protein